VYDGTKVKGNNFVFFISQLNPLN